MKVAVTGGTGFLGGHLVARLVADGYRVVFSGRTLRSEPPLGAHFEPIDLLDADGLERMFRSSEVVFHCAALSSPWGSDADFLRTNVTGTERVVGACLAAGVRRLVYVSTPSLYANDSDRFMVKETDPLPPHAINAYARTKRLAEGVVDRAGRELEVIVIRPRAIIGDGDSAIFPRILAALAARRLPVIGDGDNVADLSHVDNVVDALLLCAHADDVHLGKIYNITNDEPVRLWDVIHRSAVRLSLPPPRRRIPYRVVYGVAGALEALHRAFAPQREPRLTRYGVTVLGRSMTLDIGAAKRDLGYAPQVEMEEGLERVLELHRRAGR
jgi:nucleoside-diphosphate-sugar epimerase